MTKFLVANVKMSSQPALMKSDQLPITIIVVAFGAYIALFVL